MTQIDTSYANIQSKLYTHTVSNPSDCAPVADVYQDRHMSVGRSVSNKPDRRKKPDDPLWKSPTSMPLQYDFHAKAAYALEVTKEDVYCGTRTKFLHAHDCQLTPRINFFSGRDLWSLQLREKLEADSVSLGETLAEYKQSVNMFGSFAKKSYDFYRIMRGKGSRRKPIRVCNIANAELMYSYGIAPLAGVLFDSVEALKLELQKGLVRRYYVKGKEKSRGTDEHGSLEYYRKATRSQACTAYVTWKTSPYWQSTFSVGNPLEWAWELTPFSFVVDWALPIGTWLGTLDAMKGVESVLGTVTTKVGVDMIYSRADKENVVSYKHGKSTYRSHEREVITSIPIPPLPKVDVSSSLRRIAHGVSLLTVLNKRCR